MGRVSGATGASGGDRIVGCTHRDGACGMGGSVSDEYMAGLGAAGAGSIYSIGAIATGIVGADFNQCFVDINGVGLR